MDFGSILATARGAAVEQIAPRSIQHCIFKRLAESPFDAMILYLVLR
jgi:hypothetical protein